MNIGIESIGLTPLLSNSIEISTDDEYPIQMVVKFNEIRIYESTLYPLDGKVRFYDLCFLVQEYMRNNLISSGKRRELLLDAFRGDLVYNFDEDDNID